MNKTDPQTQGVPKEPE